MKEASYFSFWFSLLLPVLFIATTSHGSAFDITNSKTINMMSSTNDPKQQQQQEQQSPPPELPLLVIATRLHLGRAAAPPTNLSELIETFESWTRLIPNSISVIAVDATPKFEDYDYVRAVRECLSSSSSSSSSRTKVLPVTPWGKFVPALNALVSYSAHTLHAAHLCFVSAEVTPSKESMERLRRELLDDNNDVLVVGAALPGHDFFGRTIMAKETTTNDDDDDDDDDDGDSPSSTMATTTTTTTTTLPLTGRTCPWNTLAVWNLTKLQHTAFSAVSDRPDCAGVEECVAIAVHQKLFCNAKGGKNKSNSNSKAILLRLPDVAWEQDFSDDVERRQWHDQKMKSKLDRAAKQMELLQLTGTVVHKKAV
jgi:hypothetical protein